MAENVGNAGPVVIADGPFRGWMSWGAGEDPFETAIGPFCFRGTGRDLTCAFEPKRTHLNGGGTIHGGALMSFADFCLFAIAHEALAGAKAVTVAFHCEFLSPGGLAARGLSAGSFERFAAAGERAGGRTVAVIARVGSR